MEYCKLPKLKSKSSHVSSHKELAKQINFKSFFNSLVSPNIDSDVTVFSNLTQFLKIQKDLQQVRDFRLDVSFPKEINELKFVFNRLSNMFHIYIFPFAVKEFENWPQFLSSSFDRQPTLTEIWRQTWNQFDSSQSRSCIIEDKNNRIHLHPNTAFHSITGFNSFQEILYISHMEVTELRNYEVEVLEFEAGQAYNPSKMKSILANLESQAKSFIEKKGEIEIFIDSQVGALTEYLTRQLSETLRIPSNHFFSFSSFFPFDSTIGLLNFLSSKNTGIYFRVDWLRGSLLTVKDLGAV